MNTTATEYGVIIDRTRHGLGHMLVKVYANRVHAEMRADQMRTDGDYYPVVVKSRQVTRTEWAEVSA